MLFACVYVCMHYVGTWTAFVKTQFCLHTGYAQGGEFQTWFRHEPRLCEGFYPQATK